MGVPPVRKEERWWIKERQSMRNKGTRGIYDRTGMNENLIKIEIQWPGLWHGLGFKRRERYLT